MYRKLAMSAAVSPVPLSRWSRTAAKKGFLSKSLLYIREEREKEKNKERGKERESEIES